MGRSASVGGWVRRHQWVAQVGFVVVGVGVVADQPQTHPANRSACSWLCSLVDIGYLTGKPMELVDPPLLPTQLANVVLIYDW